MITPEYDMHVHTVFSGHAHESATAARMSVRAMELQMKLVCFSEHVHDQASLQMLEDLRWQLGALQRDNSCRLLVGGEFDVDPRRFDGALVTVPPSWIEFVTASVHFVPGTDIYPFEPLTAYAKNRTEMLQQWRTTLLGLAANPVVDMIGHPGVLVGVLLECYPDEVLEVFRQAAIISAERGQYWDFNELAFDKLFRMNDDYCRVLQIAVDAGVTLLYGSDAHSLFNLGRTDNVDAALTRLQGITAEELFRLPLRLKKRFHLG